MADTLRIAIAQLNPTVGDLDGNVAKALAMVEQAEAADADVVLLPEMTITGYPPEDLVLKPGMFASAAEAMRRILIDRARNKAYVTKIATTTAQSTTLVCWTRKIIGQVNKSC